MKKEGIALMKKEGCVEGVNEVPSWFDIQSLTDEQIDQLKELFDDLNKGYQLALIWYNDELLKQKSMQHLIVRQ